MTTFAKNPPDAYPSDVSKWINLIKLSNDIAVIGSIAYRSLKQYADVDLLENIEVPENFNVWTYYDMLKVCISKMINAGAYYGDMKCGTIDKYKELKKYTGSLNRGNVVGFDETGLITKINIINMLPTIKAAIIELINTYKISHQVTDWEELVEYIRNLYTIHWTKAEFLNGNKSGISGEKLILTDYILNTPIKLDMFLPINNNWIEISTIHNISKNGVPINYVPLTQQQIYDSIASNGEKFLYSPSFKSTYKGIKRMWILSRMKENEILGVSIESLINSEINNLYLAKSYLETIALMTDLKYPVDFSPAKSNINWLLSHYSQLPEKILVGVIGYVNNASTVEDIYRIKSFIMHIVNDYAKDWTKEHNMQQHFNNLISNTKEYNHSQL